jgi:Ser/Thr protein kinase RdoA (MazF antagonist)
MKAYEQLTRLGKIRRQRQIVYKALEDYDVQVKSVDFLADHTNTLFEIRGANNERYALRIYSDGETTIKENRAEMFWLIGIKRYTALKITEPIARKDGEFITLVTVAGCPADQRCALFSWVPGRPLAEAKGGLSPANYIKYGEALATLHNHSQRLNTPLPTDISPKKWDKVFYYPTEPIVYNNPAYAHMFSAERVAMLERVIAKGDRLLGQLWDRPVAPMLIHGDLHYWNVHIYQNELYLIDFEDINLGFDVQDVAITLYYGGEQENWDELKAAFKDGYSRLRRWPIESEEQLQTLIMARKMMFTNYVAHSLPAAQAKEFVDKWCVEMKRYLIKFGD